MKALRRLISGRSLIEKVGYPLLVLAIAGIVTWAIKRGGGSAHVSVECTASSRIRPGKLVTLAYKIKSDRTVDVGLGAGFYDESGGDHSTGTGDRDSLRLKSGDTRVTRVFVEPAGLAPGIYELDAEIWPANKIGADGVETLADDQCAVIRIE